MKKLSLSFCLSTVVVFCYCQNPRGVFTYENAGVAGKSGSFQFYDKDGKQVFDVKASAGYQEFANNPYFQQYKDKGPIPAGTWFLSAIKDEEKVILRLTPGDDVNNLSERDGFLIHGQGENKSIEESSHGCIILPPAYRKILMKAFKDGKKKQIPIRVMAVVSGNTG